MEDSFETHFAVSEYEAGAIGPKPNLVARPMAFQALDSPAFANRVQLGNFFKCEFLYRFPVGGGNFREVGQKLLPILHLHSAFSKLR